MVPLNDFETNSSEIVIFKKNALGKLLLNESINNWLSQVISQDCKLILIDRNNLRKIKNTDHKITFTDAYPIHLVNTASINDLNNKLKTPIIDNRFRPNIIISGPKSYEEENWKSVIIGNCEFDVIKPTERCSLITIDPFSMKKSEHQEPLRTLAKIKNKNEKVSFGIYLIPKNTGIISKTDVIQVIT